MWFHPPFPFIFGSFFGTCPFICLILFLFLPCISYPSPFHPFSVSWIIHLTFWYFQFLFLPFRFLFHSLLWLFSICALLFGIFYFMICRITSLQVVETYYVNSRFIFFSCWLLICLIILFLISCCLYIAYLEGFSSSLFLNCLYFFYLFALLLCNLLLSLKSIFLMSHLHDMSHTDFSSFSLLFSLFSYFIPTHFFILFLSLIIALLFICMIFSLQADTIYSVHLLLEFHSSRLFEYLFVLYQYLCYLYDICLVGLFMTLRLIFR